MGRIFILDEIVVKPGQTSAYCAAYERDYAPGARRRGMRIEGRWRNPPVQDFEEMPTTLYILWSVENVAGWWRMRLSRTADGADERSEKHRWWQESEHMILSRKRSFLSGLPEAS
jgi:hypothetical protein